MKITYFNDTNREINIHPATLIHGVEVEDKSPIKPRELREFILPDNVSPFIKIWDYDERGLKILVSYNMN